MALERVFQASLIKELEALFPGCVILKNDAGYLPGVPDLLVLYRDMWAMLESKKSATAKRQPNQPYYVEKFGGMSFAAFIHPGNKETVLRELQQTFNAIGDARVSWR